MPLWWNWQTRWTQNPMVAIPCRFDSDQRHHKKSADFCLRFFCACPVGVEISFDAGQGAKPKQRKKLQSRFRVSSEARNQRHQCLRFFCVCPVGVEKINRDPKKICKQRFLGRGAGKTGNAANFIEKNPLKSGLTGDEAPGKERNQNRGKNAEQISCFERSEKPAAVCIVQPICV